MAPMIPRTVAQLVLSRTIEDMRLEATGSSVRERRRKDAKDLESWSLVCREWALLVWSSNWANGLMHVRNSDGCVEQICQPLFVNCVFSVAVEAVTNNWHCTNLERLSVHCDDAHRGDFHDVLDMVRLGGERLDKFLVAAFDPSFSFSLVSLRLAGLSNATSHSILSSLSSNLVDIGLQIDGRNSPPSSILPKQLFPALKILFVELVGTTPSSFVHDAATVSRDKHRARLDRLAILDPTGWSDLALACEAIRLRHRYPLQDMPHVSEEGLLPTFTRWVTDMAHDESISTKDVIAAIGSLVLRWGFEDRPKDRVVVKLPLSRGVDPLPVEVVLKKGAELRWKREDEWAAEGGGEGEAQRA
ncbi:hypothetical protein JCM6882_003408 [Rhodosporidiobolus microsporus]